MKELANNILAQIEVDISEIDLYGYNIIDVSLSIVHSHPLKFVLISDIQQIILRISLLNLQVFLSS